MPRRGPASDYMTGPGGDQPRGYWQIVEAEAPRRLVFRDGFADAAGAPDPAMPTTDVRVTIEGLGDGRTRMTIESTFPDVEAMERLLVMGMEEGIKLAVGQIDAMLIESGRAVMLGRPYPCLWFDGKAEEAAAFYVTLLPDSRVENVGRSSADSPSGPAGMVLTVDFTLAGQRFQALNGGPDFHFNESVSFVIECADQAEVDRLWAVLSVDGGEPGPCGWIKDRFGLSWQIVPRRLRELAEDADPERARRAMEAMLAMGKIEIAELERAADGV